MIDKKEGQAPIASASRNYASHTASRNNPNVVSPSSAKIAFADVMGACCGEERVIMEAAPVAGYTDLAFRKILREQGAKVVYTEMVSATALVHGSEKTKVLLAIDSLCGRKNTEQCKTVVQLFGKNPDHFAQVINSGILDNFHEININMGCPARKIVSNGEGSALMKNLPLAKQIIEACVATGRPITVKMRLGFLYKDGNIAIKLAKIAEEAGAKKIIVHGRWQEQGYSGTANWEEIAKVVQAVNIPVIANGDIVDMESAKKCLEVTGAAGLMMARGLFGAPWRISLKENPPIDEIKEIINRHISYLPPEGFSEFKKHILAYCNSLGTPKDVKVKVAVAKDFDEVRAILEL